MELKEKNRRQTKLPQIPNKRFFTVGEASHLCGIRPHLLRNWEITFPEIKQSKRTANRRYYERHDVLLLRKIRHWIFDMGCSVDEVRARLSSPVAQIVTTEITIKQEVTVSETSEKINEQKSVKSELQDILDFLKAEESSN